MKGNCRECDRRYACDIDPDKCDEWPDPVPITNADRIRAMSDEELASFIDSETTNCAPHGDCKKVCDDCKACWLYWLQQPAEGE